MKIWQVTENDNQIRFYWFATKKEAQAHMRQYEKPFESATIDLKSVDYEPTRVGIAEAMNFVMSLTCFNEG